ncbi:MAG: STAS domain-containing protein [Candidatus Thiodiazotropha sp. (ex Dulcina madagascariensis)]|nr:STAS domain-containing protein [Candidatus Thiodiazotropha sp. (ex Dulcina madagascariensis)]
MDLECIETPKGKLIIQIKGEMDALGCERIHASLEQTIDKAHHSHLLFDFSQVGMIDSAGIGLIVSLYKRLRAKGQALAIINVQSQPMEMMALLRIDSVIPISAELRRPGYRLL